MKPSKKRPAKKAISRRTGVLKMPGQAAHVTESHSERVAAHQQRLNDIQKAYYDSTLQTFHEPESLAKRKAALRRNMAQLGKALGDWHAMALDLYVEGKSATLLKALDLKGAHRAS